MKQHFVIGPVTLILRDGEYKNYAVEVRDGKIAQYGPYAALSQTEAEIIDGEGLYLAPGFIDIHVHGGGGADFMDGTAQAVETAARAHIEHGTTTIVPTTVTGTVEELCAVFDNIKAVRESDAYEDLPELLGVHMEGPYVAPVMAGAQDPAYIRKPSDGSYKEIAAASRRTGIPISVWTVAPELEGATEICEALKGDGTVFSFGHTEAQYKHVKEAVASGYTMATHLFSSMSTIVRENGFRKLGAIESGLLMDEVTVEVIADGMHLPPELLKLILKCKGLDKVVTVTDAMRGAGMPDGIYKLGSLKNGQDTIVGGGIARMPDGISFGGSVATTDRLVRVMTEEVGLTLSQAVRLMTYNPARALHIDDRKGQIQTGYDADFVLFGSHIDVKKVFVRGKQTV